jgi:hypothetical protein
MTAPSSIDRTAYCTNRWPRPVPICCGRAHDLHRHADERRGRRGLRSRLRHAQRGRTNSRKGDRSRRFDTRAGTLEVAIPTLHSGSSFGDGGGSGIAVAQFG